MKYHPDGQSVMHQDLLKTLQRIRASKNFDPSAYVQAKCRRLNAYLGHFNLSSCIVAVSGGVDSAVVLAIATEAGRTPDSPIKNILPVLLPAFGEDGVTGQRDATDRGLELCARLGLNPFVIDIGPMADVIRRGVEARIGESGGPWARGQLAPCVRTPVLYYIANLQFQEGRGALICGTTNKDEGSYLGYMGKASDAMVDLQIISDLHKSEVYAVGRHLGAPASILGAVPTGDMHDGRVDEEVFGAPYDFVELYLEYLSASETAQKALLLEWSPEGRECFRILRGNLDALHSYNQHKYLAGSPAVHLDLRPNLVPGAWGSPPPELEQLCRKLF